MVAVSDEAVEDGIADVLGVEPWMVVQTRNWSRPGDADFLGGVRAALERRCGGELLDESADEIVDVVLLCWRAEDGDADDLVDALMDAMGNLADFGRIWLITPDTGHDGQIDPDELAESVPTAGLVSILDVSLGDGRQAIKLMFPPWRQTRPLRVSAIRDELRRRGVGPSESGGSRSP
ncbi:DUF3052 family protein [Nonomuraea phyllanthi]|uniref:DUF3052 family protein n=1 Tax=Nonomuraea phyllanthi TaxID=2219224 RepID=A0A5C4W491_9ACTN|nr:DUF3052 family protein [Nonomuraea phyllanthi]